MAKIYTWNTYRFCIEMTNQILLIVYCLLFICDENGKWKPFNVYGKHLLGEKNRDVWCECYRKNTGDSNFILTNIAIFTKDPATEKCVFGFGFFP